jgi:hypothetical protein
LTKVFHIWQKVKEVTSRFFGTFSYQPRDREDRHRSAKPFTSVRIRPRRQLLCFGTIFCCLLFNTNKVQAQKTYKHGVFWGRLVLADRISNKMKWELYAQKRTQNIPGKKSIFGGPHFSSIWLWLNYQVNKELKISVSPIGYFDSNLFFTLPDDAKNPGVKEFRWTVRAEYEIKKWLNYSNRYSVEYRTRDLSHTNNYQPNWRLRYQLKLEKPVKGILSKEKPVSFYVSDEVFIQFGKAVRSNANVFDQNRIAAGLSYEIFPNIKASVSYLNIWQQRINGKDFDQANVLWAVLTFDNLFSQFKKQYQTENQ